MYETTFHLSRRPFVAVPSADSYFAAHSIENARTSLVRLIDRYEGPAMVVGPVGTGKSLLSQILAEHYRHKCRVALIPSGRICTRRTLLQVILYELGLSYQGMEEGELRLSLIDHVTSPDFCPNGTLVMVDEADSVPMALLDELRTMTNLVANGSPCIRLVLFGLPRLEEKFAHPRLESFNQRLAGRFYLEPLNRNETLEYIVTQFDECGGDSSLTFSNESLEAIYRATNGVPRMINQLTDHTLILATADAKTFVDQELVNAAWSDLQQLPAPTSTAFGPSIGAERIIEFGELDSVEPAGKFSDRGVDPTIALDNVQRQITELQDSDKNDDNDDSSEVDDEVIDGPISQDGHDHDRIAAQNHVIQGEMHDKAAPTQEVEQEDTAIHLHEVIDPFDDSFEYEEVVVNRIAPASTVANRKYRVVSSDESEQLSQKLFGLSVVSPDVIDDDDQQSERTYSESAPQANAEGSRSTEAIKFESFHDVRRDERNEVQSDVDIEPVEEVPGSIGSSDAEDYPESPGPVNDHDAESPVSDDWDDEFDPALEPDTSACFHEFIVDSEAERDSQDCVPESLSLDDWISDDRLDPTEIEAEQRHDVADESSLEVEPLETECDPAARAEFEPSSHDYSPANPTENLALDDLSSPIDSESQPEFVIPELTEADGVMVSVREFGPFSIDDPSASESSVTNTERDADSDASEMHELRLRDDALDGTSNDSPGDDTSHRYVEYDLEVDSQEVAIEGEQTNLERQESPDLQIEFSRGDVDSISATDHDLAAASTDAVPTDDEIKLSMLTEVDDNQHRDMPTTEKSQVDGVEPTERPASTKRFNRLFSKLGSK